MTYGMMNAAHSLYRETNIRGSVEGADRHQLISLLLDALIERMNLARGQIQHTNVAGKGESFSRAIAMVTELRQSLDHSVDPTLSGRLDSLYDYITRRLLQAQLTDDVGALDECIALITPIREAWQGIREAHINGQTATPSP
jgi:flagellar protein FliS